MIPLGMVMLPRTLVAQCESTLSGAGLCPENEPELNVGNGKVVAVVMMSSMFLVSLLTQRVRLLYAKCHSHPQHRTHPSRETLHMMEVSICTDRHAPQGLREHNIPRAHQRRRVGVRDCHDILPE